MLNKTTIKLPYSKELAEEADRCMNERVAMLISVAGFVYGLDIYSIEINTDVLTLTGVIAWN